MFFPFIVSVPQRTKCSALLFLSSFLPCTLTKEILLTHSEKTTVETLVLYSGVVLLKFVVLVPQSWRPPLTTGSTALSSPLDPDSNLFEGHWAGCWAFWPQLPPGLLPQVPARCFDSATRFLTALCLGSRALTLNLQWLGPCHHPDKIQWMYRQVSQKLRSPYLALFTWWNPAIRHWLNHS